MFFVYFCLAFESVSASQISTITPLVNLSQLSQMRIERALLPASRTAEFTAVQDHLEQYEQLSLYGKLSRLEFQSCRPPGGIASLLASHQNLEELSLICLSLDETDFSAILQLENLQTLDLRGCQLVARQLYGLIENPNLKMIDLRGSSLKLAEIEAIQNRCHKKLLLMVDR